MKHEWRKREKNIYIPKSKPEIIDIPSYKFISISGEGNPNSEAFPNYIEALYAISYAIKMCKKKGMNPDGFFDYTVYPLEGVWDINEEAKKRFNGTINKDDLLFKLMIRQPDFVNIELFETILNLTKKKKPLKLLDKLVFEEIKEGKCIQMLHLGSYDSEPATFKVMEDFAIESKLTRSSKIHREIYLSDARKVSPDKLKTVLRFNVE